MRTLAFYAELLRMGKSVFTTADAALRTGVSVSSATQHLTRLRDEGLARKIFRGLWTLERTIDPLMVPEHLTTPFPAYVSFQSALYFHGMIGQIPQITYVASLGATRRVRTSVGTYSIHRLAPGYFGGYETSVDTGVHLATSEKALVDVLYLASARSRLFSALPELHLGRAFDLAWVEHWVKRIEDASRRTMVRKRLERLLGRRIRRLSKGTVSHK